MELCTTAAKESWTIRIWRGQGRYRSATRRPAYTSLSIPAPWDESKHPRDDRGRFGYGSGGSYGSSGNKKNTDPRPTPRAPGTLYADSGRVVSDAGGREKSNAQKAEAVHLSPSKLWGKAVSELVRSPSRNGTEAEWREWEAEALGVGADATVWKERMLAMYRSSSKGAALTKEGDTTPEGKMWKYDSSGVKAAKSFTEKLNAANVAGNSFSYIEFVAHCNELWRLRSKRTAQRAFLPKFVADFESLLENYVLFFSKIKRYIFLSSEDKEKGTLRCSLASTCYAVARGHCAMASIYG